MFCALCNQVPVASNNLCGACLDCMEAYLDSQYGCLNDVEYLPPSDDECNTSDEESLHSEGDSLPEQDLFVGEVPFLERHDAVQNVDQSDEDCPEELRDHTVPDSKSKL